MYPYTPGAMGTAVGSFLAGRAPLAGAAEKPGTRFVDAVHLEINTITPNDFSFWETIDELVRQEPAGAADPEILGQLAAVGIRKGQPFAPDARMRAILEEAVVVGNATARTVTFAARPEEGFAFYPNSQWSSALSVGGYERDCVGQLACGSSEDLQVVLDERAVQARTDDQVRWRHTGTYVPVCAGRHARPRPEPSSVSHSGVMGAPRTCSVCHLVLRFVNKAT
jgi:hypothetical protein